MGYGTHKPTLTVQPVASIIKTKSCKTSNKKIIVDSEFNIWAFYLFFK